MLRRHLSKIVIGVAVAVLLVGIGLGFYRVQNPTKATDVEVAGPTTTRPATVTGTLQDPPGTSLVADATGPTVDLFAKPGEVLADRPSLDNPTHEGLGVVFLVLRDQGDWLKVRVSTRPNGTEAWIKRSQVSLRKVQTRIKVEVGARRITLLQGDKVVLSDTIAVGRDNTPTPLGDFFVDGIVDVPVDSGPYGAYQVSVSGFSEVLHSFGGGVGQIALHGTNRPNLLGQAVSNGCVRMSNDTITTIARTAPTGTPVEIVA